MIFHIKKFIYKYNWKGINYPSEKKIDWRKFEKNNLTIVLHVLLSINEKLYPMFQNKTQSVKNTLFYLMISNGERWHYIAVKQNYFYY